MDENFSIFDMVDIADQQNKEKGTTHIPSLEIVKAQYIEAQSMTVSDLFDGFDELRAVTYSSGMGFLCDIVNRFNQAEVIFGCEDVLSFNLQEVMAFQDKTVERLRVESKKHKVDLLPRIDADTLRFYVARKKLSHEKIYLLSSEDGKKRVITGSANMSRAAFGGIQRENIICFDDVRAYEWFLGCFEELKETSTSSITKSALLKGNAGENIGDLPIIQEIQVKKSVVIEPEKHAAEEVRFALDVKNLAKKLTPHMTKEDKKGVTFLSPESVLGLKRRITDAFHKEKEALKKYPELVIDVENSEAWLNEERLNLEPAEEEVRRDVSLFLEYMEGYHQFHGDYHSLQHNYYAFAVWFFTTPFMAVMRNTANSYNHSLMMYPVFGILYGQSKAGKTTFLETLIKMMIGQKTKLAAPDFTRSSIDALRRSVKGSPIIVDDLTQTRFSQHGIETIKNDDFGIVENSVTYPAVVISANEDIKAVAPEVVRRAVICHVKAGLKNTDMMRSNTVRKVQKSIGTALYRAYLKRMLEIMPQMINELKSEEDDFAPDLVLQSSKVLAELIEQYCDCNCPSYIRSVSIENYFDEKVTGSQVMKQIQEAWHVNRKAFQVDKRTGKLTYNAGMPYEADRMIKELPEDLEAHKAREMVIMKLDKAVEFFGIDFKQRRLLSRVKDFF